MKIKYSYIIIFCLGLVIFLMGLNMCHSEPVKLSDNKPLYNRISKDSVKILRYEAGSIEHVLNANKLNKENHLLRQKMDSVYKLKVRFENKYYDSAKLARANITDTNQVKEAFNDCDSTIIKANELLAVKDSVIKNRDSTIAEITAVNAFNDSIIVTLKNDMGFMRTIDKDKDKDIAKLEKQIRRERRKTKLVGGVGILAFIGSFFIPR